MVVIETELGALANETAEVAFATERVDGAPTTGTDGTPTRSRLIGLLVCSLLFTLASAACDGDDGERDASTPQDAEAGTDPIEIWTRLVPADCALSLRPGLTRWQVDQRLLAGELRTTPPERPAPVHRPMAPRRRPDAHPG
jgi:hypothetical protein